MKKITITIVWASYCLYFSALGQNLPSPKALHIGDKMPDVTLINVLNSKQNTIDLSKSRGKLILLDFWNSWCSTCIDGFAELDSLQKLYPQKLQVILVNSSPNEKKVAVDMVLSRSRAWSPNGFKLPVVYPDTLLRPYFPFRSVPHTIWISPGGVIIAITDKKAVTPANIIMAIKGLPMNLKLKTD